MPPPCSKAESCGRMFSLIREVPMAKKLDIGPITKVVKSDEEWKKLLARAV